MYSSRDSSQFLWMDNRRLRVRSPGDQPGHGHRCEYEQSQEDENRTHSVESQVKTFCNELCHG